MNQQPIPDITWGIEDKLASYPLLDNDICVLLKKILGPALMTAGSHTYTWAVFSNKGLFKGLKVTRWVPKNCVIAGKISLDSLTCSEDNLLPVINHEEIKDAAPQILIRKSELG